MQPTVRKSNRLQGLPAPPPIEEEPRRKRKDGSHVAAAAVLSTKRPRSGCAPQETSMRRDHMALTLAIENLDLSQPQPPQPIVEQSGSVAVDPVHCEQPASTAVLPTAQKSGFAEPVQCEQPAGVAVLPGALEDLQQSVGRTCLELFDRSTNVDLIHEIPYSDKMINNCLKFEFLNGELYSREFMQSDVACTVREEHYMRINAKIYAMNGVIKSEKQQSYFNSATLCASVPDKYAVALQRLPAGLRRARMCPLSNGKQDVVCSLMDFKADYLELDDMDTGKLVIKSELGLALSTPLFMSQLCVRNESCVPSQVTPADFRTRESIIDQSNSKYRALMANKEEDQACVKCLPLVIVDHTRYTPGRSEVQQPLNADKDFDLRRLREVVLKNVVALNDGSGNLQAGLVYLESVLECNVGLFKYFLNMVDEVVSYTRNLPTKWCPQESGPTLIKMETGRCMDYAVLHMLFSICCERRFTHIVFLRSQASEGSESGLAQVFGRYNCFVNGH